MTVPDGYVPTPAPVADYAASIAFGALRPSEVTDGGRLLLPGLGTGNLFDAVRRYCRSGDTWCNPEFDYPLPECVGVEVNGDRLDTFRAEHEDPPIEVHNSDFLRDPPAGSYDWVLANPPYSRYKALDADAREAYRDRYALADGQFPLFMPFFEQAYRLLRDGGWMTFILPTSVLQTEATRPLREVLRHNCTGPIRYLPEKTFDQTVSTCVIGMKKGDRSAEARSLWLDRLRHGNLREILTRLNVTDIEGSIAQYGIEHKSYRRTVRSIGKRERAQSKEPTRIGETAADVRDTQQPQPTREQAGITEFA